MGILFLLREQHQEPLGAGYLISAARRAGHDAEGRFFSTPAQAAAIAAKLQPRIVAFSVMTGSQDFYLHTARLIKKRLNVFSIFGGPHPTYSPEMINEDGADAVCRGEGETALVDFLNRFRDGKDFFLSSNFVFKSGGEIIKNALSPLITDLDSLPFPDRAFFYQTEPLRISHLKSFIASRGCPYSCTYCFNHIHNEIYRGLGPVVRRRSVDNVIQEVLEVKNRFPLGMIQFMDDTFILSREWVEELSEKFPARAGVPFFCNVRAELVTHEIVRDLKRAGCASVCVGIETADEDLRRQMLGRSQTNDQIRRACELFRANKIKVMTTNMLGIPGGTLASDMKTFRLNAECRVDYAWASLTYPYPGTRIHALAAELGMEVPAPDSLSQSYFNAVPFEIPDKNKVENLHRLLAFAANFRMSDSAINSLTGARGRAAGMLYTLVFGLWKLYCYESRIFRRRGVWWPVSPDFVPRFARNIMHGLRMMSAGRAAKAEK